MQDHAVKVGRVSPLALAVAAVLTAGPALAQDDAAAPAAETQATPVEQVVVTGRLIDAQESLTLERFEAPVSADFLGAEVISRAGDSDIAAALRRVPGITLVDGKFVYVRGLGERYSSVLVNGAAVPSPDLTRSVVPLDILPTSMVESIKIQKSPSPESTAAFGGGMINIRTKNTPDGPVATFDFGYGFNSLSDGDGLSSDAGGSALPPTLRDAINTYEGDISVSSILGDLRSVDPLAPLSQAESIHQSLIDSLDQNVRIREESLDPDVGAKLALGNAWYFGDDDQVTFGVLFNGTYNEQWRNEDQRKELVGNPETSYTVVERTKYEERAIASLQLGVDYTSDHSIQFSSYSIRDDEDEAGISRGYDANNQFPDQNVSYLTRLQERELTINQIAGSHAFLESFDFIGRPLERWGMQNLTIDWIYSDSSADTAIPNATTFQAGALLDPATGQELSTGVLPTATAGQFQFLDLEDEQESYGGDVNLPLDLENMVLKLSGGWWGSRKDRSYSQYYVNLNAIGVQEPLLSGSPGDVLEAGNATVTNGFDLTLGSQFGTESYLAAQTVDAAYGSIDFDWDTWRFMVGARWEDYQQAVLPLDLLDFTGVSLFNTQQALLDPAQRLAVREDDVYASAALTYNGTGALGSADYQLRASYGETVVRPDLREVADVVYIDPELGIRVKGAPSLTSSPIQNFEVRSEFYYGRGDNFTISLFYKDIESPIEQINQAGPDSDIVLSFANAKTGEVTGLELEGLMILPAGMFLSGNATVSESEVLLDPNIPTIATHMERPMTGHSKWVFNSTLGWDSANGLHGAYLNFNSFGERIWYAGTEGNDDAFEQPFQSLGVVYKYFPTDHMQFEFSLDNLLDEDREFEQVNNQGQIARVLVQDVGVSFGASVVWTF
jgi:outer membrane cobalamin receptor